jgi:hypothetical protein
MWSIRFVVLWGIREQVFAVESRLIKVVVILEKINEILFNKINEIL